MQRTAALNVRSSQASLSVRLRKYKWYYFIILPVFSYFVIFHYAPMYGVVVAFKDYKMSLGIFGSEWVGLKYFRKLVEAPFFWRALKNTLIFALYRMTIVFAVPIIYALLLNELQHKRFKKTIQTISYLPHFISWIILTGIFIELLSPSRGFVNYIIQFFGKQPIYFLGDENYFRGTVVVTGIWQSMGWSSIMYLAAIASVDQEQYESAYIEGANRFQMAWHITLPSIMGTIVMLYIFAMGGILNSSFDQIFNMMNDVTRPTGEVIDTYVYNLGLQRFEYSFSTAVGLFKNSVGFILVILSNYIVRFVGKEEFALW